MSSDSDVKDPRDVALGQINAICHRPSKDHPKGGHAYTHFMADFDEIRAICAKFLNERSQNHG
jgi:hypothetical protein